MRFKDYSGTEQFRPLSAWAYFGYAILFAIPIIGWLLLIIFTFSSRNYNRRSFARSYWCGLIVAVIIIGILVVTGIGCGWLYEKIPGIHQYLPATMSPIASTLCPTAKPKVTGVAQTMVNVSQTPAIPPVLTDVLKSSGVTSECKEMMDAYELFFDRYIAFMDSYDASNINQLSKYVALMTQYTETMEALEKVDETSLSQADDAYCMEVTMRINKKLADFALRESYP
ncbi:MAG: hypothetical protein RR482_02670 [Clostridia bacterium]